MTTALYRKSSNEVVKISLTDQQFSDINATYWGVLTDPTLPDGTVTHDSLGALRVLGFAKIANVPGNIVRNATQLEIDTFALEQADDESLQDADAAISIFETHPRFRKVMIAYSDILKDEFNICRSWTRDLKAAVAASTSLANFQTRVAALPTLQDRTLSQLKTAIRNRISKDD